MFNPNDMRNMWPSVTPIMGQQTNRLPFGLYNNNQTFSQNNFSQQIPITRPVLQNQQNVNQFPYFNQNQGFGQQFTPFNNYNSFRPPPQQQLNQTNSSFMFQNHLATETQTISQPNIGLPGNPLPQTYPSIVQKPIQSLVYPQVQTNSMQSISGTNDQNWLNLLNPSQKSVLEVLNKEQEEFELQFKNWEKEFENWKAANRSHPDRNAYHSYVSQWQEWRQKLVARQQQMKELHNRTMNQLYSQVQQQSQQTLQSSPEVPPPPPPLPQNMDCIPPPPPPSSPPPQDSQIIASSVKLFPSTVLGPNKIPEKIPNLNEDKSEDLKKSEISGNKQNFIKFNLFDKKDFNESNPSSLKPLQSNNPVVIESESKTTKSVCEEKSETNSNIESKTAENILFIQKEQNSLNVLDNFNRTNQFSADQKIDGPKPFDVNDIATKAKGIRPSENPRETSQTSSQLPPLQGNVFNQNLTPNSENSFNLNRHQHRQQQQQFNSNNQPFNRVPQEPYQRFQNNYRNPMPLPDYRMHEIRPQRLPFEANSNRFQRPQLPNNIGRQFQSFNSVDNNRWMDSRNSNHRDREYLYGVNDTNCSNFIRNNSLPPPPQQSSNMSRRYSAQTIDYNHKPENRNFNLREESHHSRPPVEQLPHNYHNFDDKINKNFNIPPSVPLMNGIHSSRNPFDSPAKKVVEEKYTYRDLRYFTEPTSRIVLIDDLLKPPSREFRPQNIVIILRGLPGSGKTHIAKMIKEKEVEFGGSAPRILSIDDYFMTEIERETKDGETRKMVKEYVYEYEGEMESSYRASLLKTFKKTIDDRLFPFIIIDAVNELVGYIEEFYSYAIQNGFVVYVTEMDCSDPSICHKRNIHKRNLEEIKILHKKWQNLPDFMLRLDIRSFLQNNSIEDVDMDSSSSKTNETLKRKAESESEGVKKQATSDLNEAVDTSGTHNSLSRWERMESSEAKLDKLDSFKMKTKLTIEEYLQVTDDYEQRQGQKRVRWADIEESKKQAHMRKIGFVVGVDWQQFMDPQHCERALTKTKYF